MCNACPSWTIMMPHWKPSLGRLKCVTANAARSFNVQNCANVYRA